MDELLAGAPQDDQRAELARVAAPAPASASDPLFVTVRSFDGGRHAHGPCLWEPPAGALPAVGELCVIVRAIEEDGEGEQAVVIAFDRNDSAALDAEVAALDSRLDAIEAGPEALRYVGTAGQPAFQNAWVNSFAGTPGVTAGMHAAAFAKDRGRVHLQGVVKSGPTNTVVFNLPVGYRPSPADADLYYIVHSSGGVAQAYVQADGDVVVNTLIGAPGVSTFCYLNGVDFRAA